jgi:NAD-dependent histone deacetylase SIR2
MNALAVYGEGLPDRYHKLSTNDLRQADLLLVLGTSLRVYPFAGLIDIARCPKVLINLEPAGDMSDFDVKVLRKSDDAIAELADMLGWKVRRSHTYNALHQLDGA